MCPNHTYITICHLQLVLVYKLLVTHREIDGDDVAEPLLVVEEGGEVGDQDDQHRWHVDRHEVAEDRPLEHDLNLAESTQTVPLITVPPKKFYVSTLSKFSLKKLKYENCSYVRVGTVRVL